MPWGTLLNVVTVLVGCALGLGLRAGLPERVRGIIFQAIGLCTLVLGMINALKVDSAKHLLEVIFSVILGGLLGEGLRLEDRLLAAGDWLKARIKLSSERFSEGLVTAFLIFCIGPLTIMGALDEGLRQDPSLLYTKALLDGFMSIALVSTFGIGVAFSVIPLFFFQAGISLLGALAGDVLGPVAVTQLTAVGGVLILGLGINILGLSQIRVANMLPALVVIVILSLLLG